MIPETKEEDEEKMEASPRAESTGKMKEKGRKVEVVVATREAKIR